LVIGLAGGLASGVIGGLIGGLHSLEAQVPLALGAVTCVTKSILRIAWLFRHFNPPRLKETIVRGKLYHVAMRRGL